MTKSKKKGSSGLSAILAYYRNEAKRKGYEWALNKEDLEKLVTDDCYLCGNEPSKIVTGPKSRQSRFGEDHSQITVNEIERVDLNQGYVPGNCITCCQTCKVIKKEMGLDEFCSWIEKTYLYTKKKAVHVPESAKPIYTFKNVVD